MEYELKKKKSNIKKIILGSFLGILIGSVFGVSIAMFSYNTTSINGKLVVGDIYMKYQDNNELTLQNVMPTENYIPNGYFEFEVTGKNTTTDKDIIYDIVLNHGADNPDSRTTRIDDKFLKFRLVEVQEENNVKTEQTPDLIEGQSYSTIDNTRIYVRTIPKNTISDIRHIYRLYMWIDNSVVIGNTNQDYTLSEWQNVYASISVTVTGDFNDKELTPVPLTSSQLIQNIKTNNLKDSSGTPLNYVTETDNGETITYLSGCSKYYLDQNVEECTQDNTIDFNYVWYSGRMWRITSFNETTNTIKLITQEPQTAIVWHKSSVNFEGSYVEQFLNEEFYDTLYRPTNFIDSTIQWNATQVSSIETKPSKTTMVTSNVGLINTYECYKSYEKLTDRNKQFGYLNIGQYWFLLNNDSSNIWRLNPSGSIGLNYPNSGYAVRPSINLKSTLKFTGSGTESNPYRLVGDKEVGMLNSKINLRTVGEYVKLKNGANEQVFRIVGFEDNSTKLIQLDYIKENNELKTLKFATSNDSSLGDGTIFGEGNAQGSGTWFDYLTTTYINDLKTKYGSNLFTTGEYYIGINADNSSYTTELYSNYRTSICSSNDDLTKNCTKSRSKTLEAGLLRYGEMFAAQHGIGRNNVTYNYLLNHMFLMTKYRWSNDCIWSIDNTGTPASFASPTSTLAARPSINLASGVKILSGTGLPHDPYVVGL